MPAAAAQAELSAGGLTGLAEQLETEQKMLDENTRLTREIHGLTTLVASWVRQQSDLTAGLLQLKAGTAEALAHFQEAGGADAVQNFLDQVQLVKRYPESPDELDRLASLAPAAARLLEAAVQLASAVALLNAASPAGNDVAAGQSRNS